MSSPAWSTLLPLAGAALPFAIIFVLSRYVRWPLLAERYPLRGEQPGPKLRLGYGVLRRWVGYNGGLVVSADAGGLYLSTMPILLSFCHDPVFIAWPEVVEIRRRERWSGLLYEIHLRQAPEVDLALRASTFDFVRAHAERAGVPGDYRRA